MSKKILKSWSKEEIKELIELYEAHELLWNTKCLEYRNRTKKQEVYEEIGEKFSCSSAEVQRKLHNLRNQVSQEIKKKKKQGIAYGTDKFYQSTWPHFNSLKFVIPDLISCSTKSNVVETHSETSNEGSIIDSVTPDIKMETSNIKRKMLSKKPIPTPSKRKFEEEDVVVKAALQILGKGVPDEHDRFGQYVALELRSLQCDFVRRKLKNEIRKAIVSAADEDEAFVISSIRDSV